LTSRIIENSLVAVVGGAAGAIASAIINNFLLKSTNISYWWIGALLGIFVALLLYFLYQQGFGGFPVQKWRVTNSADCTGLGSGGQIIRRAGQNVCQIDTSYDGWAVWGPGGFCREYLRKGKYVATFRIKANHKSGPNLPIIEISASVKTDNGLGTKYLAARTLSPIDFKEDDEYQDFPLHFEIFDAEYEFELRVYSKSNQRIITLDYIQVSRRLF